MEAFRPSAHALKRVVAGLGSELAPILSLEMAARDVSAHRRKHATRKPVQVRNAVSNLCFCVFCFFVVLVCFEGVLDYPLVENSDCDIRCTLLVIHVMHSR